MTTATQTVPVPASILRLPVDPVRKIPVPWFVAWIDGKPEFRAMGPGKRVAAMTERLCWVCGERLDNRATYVIGPMCAINRISAEPPSHPACAEYSARVCPFLSRPHMERRENDMPMGGSPGIAILRNPGVTLLWTGRVPGARLISDGAGSFLYHLNPPIVVSWWAEGRAATRAEVDRSVVSGLPYLREMAEAQGPEALEALAEMVRDAEPIFATAGPALEGGGWI